MKISFATRQAARTFAQQRTAKGLPSPVLDSGKAAHEAGKRRYAVDISKKQ